MPSNHVDLLYTTLSVTQPNVMAGIDVSEDIEHYKWLSPKTCFFKWVKHSEEQKNAILKILPKYFTELILFGLK